MKKNKFLMHTPLNFSTMFIFPIMFAVGIYFVWKDAYNDTLRLFGIIFMILLFIGLSVFLIKFMRVFDWIVFTESTIERHSPIGKAIIYKYGDVFISVGKYSSILEKKDYLIFSPKALGKVAFHIDTSKQGNAIYINRNNFLYCPITPELINYLSSKEDLQWVVKSK